MNKELNDIKKKYIDKIMEVYKIPGVILSNPNGKLSMQELSLMGIHKELCSISFELEIISRLKIEKTEIE